jgi:hypothetical protein
MIAFCASFIIMTMDIGSIFLYSSQQAANAFTSNETDLRGESKAPTAISGDNVYVAWWSNKTGNDEVMFRASNDNGLTFGDKINLSNTTNAESVDDEILADGENVYVT